VKTRKTIIEEVHTKGEAMLIKAKAAEGYSLKSLDGDIGSQRVLLRRPYWAFRYLVATPETWLSGRKV